MRNQCWLRACGILILVVAGCQSRQPAVREVRSASGLTIRQEIGEDGEEKAQRDPQLVRERMEQYRSSKKATTRASSTGPSANLLFLQSSFDPFEERNCPPEGTAKGDHTKDQNRLKNRIETPTASDFDHSVTLAKLKRKGDDTDRWSSDHAVTIIGYIRKAAGTGAETCNCAEEDEALTDTHMDVVSGPFDQAKPVIAEITPVWRIMHAHDGVEDWSSAAVKAKYEGHRVKITGWLFFDDFHKNEADNTDPGDKKGNKNWRRTCWEIHPVTKIELFP